MIIMSGSSPGREKESHRLTIWKRRRKRSKHWESLKLSVRGRKKQLPAPVQKGSLFSCCTPSDQAMHGRVEDMSVCARIMWILLAIAILLAVVILVWFRAVLFGNETVADVVSGWFEDDCATTREVRDHGVDAEKVQAENEKAEKKLMSKLRKRFEKEKPDRETLNDRSLKPSDFHLEGLIHDRQIKKAEEYYIHHLNAMSYLKMQKEKLWAVAILLYTNKANYSLDFSTGKRWYAKVNMSLRNGDTEYHKYRDILNDALNCLILHQMEEDVEVPSTLWRGIGFPRSDGDLVSEITANNCETFGSGLSYISTSAESRIALGFANGKTLKRHNSYRFIMKLKGVTCAAKITDYGMSKEVEWLIPAGVTFQIETVEGDPRVSQTGGAPCNVIARQNAYKIAKRRRLISAQGWEEL